MRCINLGQSVFDRERKRILSMKDKNNCIINRDSITASCVPRKMDEFVHKDIFYGSDS